MYTLSLHDALPIYKKYDDETNLRCQIVIDTSSSMSLTNTQKGNEQLSKLQWSSLAAASLLYLLHRQRDAFGLTIFDESIHTHRRASGSLKQMRLLLSYLESLFEEKQPVSRKTNLAQTLHEVADRIDKRSLVVIFSDFFEHMDQPDPIFSALQHLKYNKHEVIAFNVVDQKKEVEFDFQNKPMRFIDYEKGEQIKLRPQEIQEDYREKMEDFIKLLELKSLQIGEDIIADNINKSIHDQLRAFLLRRNKMK